MLKCTRCQQEKEYSSFTVRKASPSGYTQRCKECIRIVRQEDYRNNPKKHKDRARKYRENKIEYCRAKNRERSKKRTLENPEYMKQYYLNNKEKWKYVSTEESRAAVRERRRKNPEKIKQRSKQYYYKNKLKQNKACSEYKKNNKYTINTLSAERRARKRNATIGNFRTEIRQIYKECADRCSDLETFQVDHIIPLTHPDICGLHVPWNLQILSTIENNIKSNKFDGTYHNSSWRLLVPS